MHLLRKREKYVKRDGAYWSEIFDTQKCHHHDWTNYAIKGLYHIHVTYVSTYCAFCIYQKCKTHQFLSLFSLSQAVCPCICVRVHLFVPVFVLVCVSGKIQSHVVVPEGNSRFTCWLTWLVLCIQQTLLRCVRACRYKLLVYVTLCHPFCP